ncbi:MAG: hypothetical protein UY79_C0005G0002 [Parcubacteria group bacterium GW2011_GWA2_53_21]|nr:MAG: hypothetical protein UY79_C0005G0002 [Parcubacteria group bacterium GW2011_GWA2_53_21]
MTRTKPAQFVFYGWRTILLVAVLGLIVAVILSFFQSLKYRSTTRLLISQNTALVDAYTASRSNERVADDMATLVHTSSFYNAVMNAGFNIRENYFPSDELKRRKLWNKTIKPTVLRGTGLIQIDAFHPSVDQAEQIARAAAFILSTRAEDFSSAGGVNVRQVDEPLNTRFPVKPNIPVNALTGLVLGGLAGLALVAINLERMKRRHQLIHEEW